MRGWILMLLLLVACGSTPPPPAATGPIDFPVLSHGTKLDLAPHVEPGKVTVFDFYADWCPPCKKLDLSLADLKHTYGDRLVVKKVDIVNWESEVAVQYGIKDLPHLKVYTEQGSLLSEGTSVTVLPKLIKLLGQ